MELTYENILDAYESGDFQEFLEEIKEIHDIKLVVTDEIKLNVFKGNPENIEIFKNDKKVFESDISEEIVDYLMDNEVEEDNAVEAVGTAFMIGQMILSA